MPKIHLHPVLFIFMALTFVTGMFTEYLIILSIVFIHELGHFLMAKFYKWRIHKIMMWVFGGVMETDEHVNRPMKEEFLVTIAGPLQHIWIHFFLIVYGQTLLSPNMLSFAQEFNVYILLFNLLPIWPLDGGKLLSLLIAKFLPFRKTQQFIIGISICCALLFIVIQIMINPFTLGAMFLMFFLLNENWLEWRRRYYIFMRFLLKRMAANKYHFKKVDLSVNRDERLIEVFSKFKRDKQYTLTVNDAMYQLDEVSCLELYFSGIYHHPTIEDACKYERFN